MFLMFLSRKCNINDDYQMVLSNSCSTRFKIYMIHTSTIIWFTDFAVTLNCSTPFELHDDSYVVKAMGLCTREKNDGSLAPCSDGGDGSIQKHTSPSSRANSMARVLASPPKPGILKSRVKNEH